MELFVSNDTVSELEQAFIHHTNEPPVSLLIHLAWSMRQRDTQRALKLCDQADEKLNASQQQTEKKNQCIARVLLIRAEIALLRAHFVNARTQANAALEHFTLAHDDVGLADTHWLFSILENDAGDIELQQKELGLCMTHATAAGDQIRFEIANACNARLKVFEMRYPEEQSLVSHFDHLQTQKDQGLLTWVFNFLAGQAVQYSDFATATALFIRAADAALHSGQIARAVAASSNVCFSMARLGDHESSLKWGHRAIQLARQKDWPISLGVSLVQTAEAFRKIDQFDSSKELLNEALRILSKVPNTRNYLLALRSLAEITLAQSAYDKAYDCFKQLYSHPLAQLQLDFQCISLRGQAQALLGLERIEAALNAANLALDIATQNHYQEHHLLSLWVLADIYSAKNIIHGTSPEQNQLALDYLLKAVAIGKQIQDYTIPDKLYSRIAEEYAKRDEYTEAYRYSLCAFSSREKSLNADISNSAIALQLRLQVEKAISDNEHHQAMVEEKERRALLLEKNNETLSILGTIGQEITTQLELENIYQVLLHHVNNLLDATHLSIWLLDNTGSTLTLAYGMEAGTRLSQYAFPVDSPVYYSSRCVRERREILVELLDDINTASQLPGTLSMETLLFAPLIVAERVIGVMSVQSPKQRAYPERERLIFRTLCSYSAIALDNAHAYQQLMDARHLLVDQEKMAALGSLVAGVAHEMNTPIGNSLLIASTIAEKTNTVIEQIHQQNLKRRDLDDYLKDVQQGSKLILNGLTAAATMLSSFKQVAVDRNTEHKRRFNLLETCQDIIASMRNRIVNSAHELHLDIAHDLVLNSYPGPLGQVLTNMIENALLHAFDGHSHGQMTMSAERVGSEQIKIYFTDDGNGIPEKNIRHIFEPFFSTRFGQGGSGLGLSISYNIVTSILHGQLSVKSKPGEGTCFTLLLPLEAPDMVN